MFFKVGLITLIGLSAKNAILIIEFAKSLVDQGVDAADAAVQAARLRLRPIVMTLAGVHPRAWCRWPLPAAPARPARRRSVPG
ncbi:multidrug/solvent RND transporter, AcrB-like protein [Pseudomonas putida S11]|nr:multidrug/solvent RND transporter, AcrB-like protein [Pseudomonas putida S11]